MPRSVLWAVPPQLCHRLIRHCRLQVFNRPKTICPVVRAQALKLGALVRREVRQDLASPEAAPVAVQVAARVAAQAEAQVAALVVSLEAVVFQVGSEDPQPARQAGTAQAVVVHQAEIRPVAAIQVSTRIGGHKATGFLHGDLAGDQAATPTQICREAVVEALSGLEVAPPTVLVVILCMICWAG